MIDTILFDLDGTLLPLDIDKFTEIYFNEMGHMFKDMIEPKLLVKYIWAATQEMVANIEYKTNEEVFMKKFSELIGGDITEYQTQFDDFYDTLFHKTREAVQSQSVIKDSVDILKAKNYKLVIATNPLFPRKAILHRIEWAGLDPKDFIYITSYENNHYCKPQLHFYQEILDVIGKKPEQCMMVGNDVQEDLVAARLGTKTFLVEDNIINRSNMEIISDYRGTYQELFQFVEALPNLHEHNDKDVI